MQTNYEVEQLSMFGQDTWHGRTCPVPLVQEHPKARTSGSSWKRSSALKAIPFQSLDLTPGAGNLLGEFYWELISPWRGGASTLNTGVSPRGAKESSLSQILQADPPLKYYLSPKACLGILRRAFERGKELPPKLEGALKIQAGLTRPSKTAGMNSRCTNNAIAFAANQRDEVRDLHDVAGALQAQPGIKQQTFVAGFSAGAGASAGSIGYNESVAPTLKGSPGGNCMPSVLCLNDQGGQIMACSENITGTLRAQERGHQPLVLRPAAPQIYENHGVDSRYTGPHKVAPTISAAYGMGGNNTSLVEQNAGAICIAGNIVDRQPENGGNGLGCQEDLAYTLTATDRHAVVELYQKTVGALCRGDEKGIGNQYVSQDKCIINASCSETHHLIRRLTPLECERLQGFPDGWTDIPGASDSARYKALGNSVAIPCVEFIMSRIAAAMRVA